MYKLCGRVIIGVFDYGIMFLIEYKSVQSKYSIAEHSATNELQTMMLDLRLRSSYAV